MCKMAKVNVIYIYDIANKILLLKTRPKFFCMAKGAIG